MAATKKKDKFHKRCDDCGKRMNPVDYLISSTCMDCCKAKHLKATGKK